MSAKPLQDPAALAEPHLGTIVRELRQNAGITRRIFAEAVNLSEPMLTMFETGRRKLSAEQLQRVLRHPAMAAARQLVVAAGIELPTEPS